MKYTIVLPGLFMVGLVAGSLPSTSIVSIPPTPQVGPSNAQFTASTQKFDSPLLGSVNSTSWEGSGVSWAGEGDGSKYVVTFDSPGLGVTGSLTLEALSPTHFPCGPPAVGQTLQFLPDIGWLSIIPNGAGVVDLVINGSSLQFGGSGYHDKNWGDTVFTEPLGSWTFGHGNLGPYSVVWFDGLPPTGLESASGYVTLNNEVLTSACGNVKARPTGVNSTFPPLQSSGNSEGFHVEWDLGEDGVLAIELKPNLVVIQALEAFTRWVGVMEGGIVAQETKYTGAIIFEEFRLLL